MVTTTRIGSDGINILTSCGPRLSRDREALGAFSLVRDEKAFALALVDFCRSGGPETPGWLVSTIGAGFAPPA